MFWALNKNMHEPAIRQLYRDCQAVNTETGALCISRFDAFFRWQQAFLERKRRKESGLILWDIEEKLDRAFFGR